MQGQALQCLLTLAPDLETRWGFAIPKSPDSLIEQNLIHWMEEDLRLRKIAYGSAEFDLPVERIEQGHSLFRSLLDARDDSPELARRAVRTRASRLQEALRTLAREPELTANIVVRTSGSVGGIMGRACLVAEGLLHAR